ncbi:MAG: Swt1 family HEPN domain-containing protein [Candidatus Bathyarchaeota archaeon]
MISSDLRDQILSRLGKSIPWFYAELRQISENLGFSFSNRIIAYVFAYENGVDPSPFIKDEELAEYRQAIQMRRTMGLVPSPQTPVSIPEDKTVRKSTPRLPKPVFVQIPEMERLNVPNLAKEIVNDASEMAKIYPLIYLYENSVREFIKEVLDKRSPDWWDKVNKGIKDRVEDRQRTEKQNAYHGKLRVHPIQYVDLDDLRNIIQSNAIIFNDYMPDKNVEYLQQKLRELKDSRNILMHCNPLTQDDMQRVRLYFADWVRQLKGMLDFLHKK